MRSVNINPRFAARLNHSFTAFKRKKVFTFIASPDELIRLSEIIKRFDKVFEHKYIYLDCDNDKHYPMLLANDLGVRKPNRWISCIGSTMAESGAKAFAKSYSLLKREKPEAIIALGDSNVIYSLVAAKELGIPSFHLGAGERASDSSSIRETNRLIADSLSEVHFPYTQSSYRNLIKQGISQNKIHLVASPMQEVLWNHQNPIEYCNILSQTGLQKNGYLVISLNRFENLINNVRLCQVMSALNQVIDHLQLPTILLIKPWAKRRIEENKIAYSPFVKPIRLPLGFIRICKLEKEAYVTLSDSANLAEEATILNYPAVLLRFTTERKEAAQAKAIALTDFVFDHILSAIKEARQEHENSKIKNIPEYQDKEVGKKIQTVIENYK